MNGIAIDAGPIAVFAIVILVIAAVLFSRRR
jgi:hypothetical protein